MTTPFFRGFNKYDFLLGAVVAQAQLYGDKPDSVAAILGSVEGGQTVNFPLTPALPAFAICTGPSLCIVNIGGTAADLQWILNVLGSIQGPATPFPGSVAGYFGAAGLAVLGILRPYVQPLLTTKQIVVIGHSLGGAIAQLLASYWQNDAIRGLSCLSLAAPRVGDPTFASAAGGVINRIEIATDPVPGLPPEQWAGVGSHFPVPGPGIIATYTHAGTAMTLGSSGVLVPGSNPPSIDQVAEIIYQRAWLPHYATTYSSYLKGALPDDSFTLGNTGYSDPETLLESYYGQQTDQPFSSPHPKAGGPMKKVTVFYSLYNRGISESFWTSATDIASVQNLLLNYLTARLTLATSDLQFVYARASDALTPRQVFWFTPDSLGFNGQGTLPAGSAVAHLAVLYRGQTLNGGSMRLFLHGFPGNIVKNNDLVRTSAWVQSLVPQFAAFLIKNLNAYMWRTVTPETVNARYDVTAITPLAPRGATITTNVDQSGLLSPGDQVYIGGAGSMQVGMTGRKTVTALNADGLAFNVGGASPIGTLEAGAYFRALTFNFGGLVNGTIERLSDHRVGKVFGLRPGRRSNLLPLRR